MASAHEQFWTHNSFALVGDSTKELFPLVTSQGLQQMGKQVYLVDVSGVQELEGQKAYRSIAELPAQVDAAVLEVPPDSMKEMVQQAADAGIKNVWIQQNCHSDEAVALAQEKKMNVQHHGCSIMYTNCTSFHRIHRFIWKVLGKY